MNADTVACQKIINAKSSFECFDLPVERVDPELVRSLYLKIAVKIHPDKNTSNLATRAFQILSESFEELHDENKQNQLLRNSGDSSNYNHRNKRRKGKKKKTKDIADLVKQTDKWYTKDWEEVENEINRMTSEFKEHLARQQERHEKNLEKRNEKKRRKEKRIKKNLNFLYEKYGIDPSDSDSDSPKSSYNYVSYLPESSADQSAPEHVTKSTESETVSDVASSSASSKESICWVCRRSFKSEEMLKLHNEKSELHRTNVEKSQKLHNEKSEFHRTNTVEKSQNPSHRFKNSFSEVKDN